jgi:hypothetical protein
MGLEKYEYNRDISIKLGNKTTLEMESRSE